MSEKREALQIGLNKLQHWSLEDEVVKQKQDKNNDN
jgi:hypothetical protein